MTERGLCARFGALCLTSACLASLACSAPRRAPAGPETASPERALATLAERATAVDALAGEGRLILVEEGGERVVLQAVLAARRPDHLRLRAFKLGQAVMDLTVRPEGTWLWTAERAGDAAEAFRPDAETESLDTALFGPWLWAALWPRFDTPVPPQALRDLTAGAFAVRSPPARLPELSSVPEGMTLEWIIDGRTAQVQSLRFIDQDGPRSERLLLRDYRSDAQGRTWPARVRVLGPSGELELELSGVELYSDAVELAPQAFDPPARADRLP